MAGKTITIDSATIEEAMRKVQAWLDNFFTTATTLELVAVGVIGLGFVLFLAGIVLFLL